MSKFLGLPTIRLSSSTDGMCTDLHRLAKHMAVSIGKAWARCIAARPSSVALESIHDTYFQPEVYHCGLNWAIKSIGETYLEPSSL